ncbi:MAG: C10 family peptidase [Prevotella sp.]|nr:C10 family peptidase [Prevotella sp.]
MKRIVFSILFTIATFCGVHADVITQSEAESIAQQFLTHQAMHCKMPLKTVATKLTPAYMKSSQAGVADVYAFNVEDNGGFIVIAGDDKVVTPVLGFSDKGRFPTSLPENLKSWMDEYARQIEYLRNSGYEAQQHKETPRFSEPDASIPEQLITTQWAQTEVYADSCPLRTFSGCVATAMAQVMNYWKWPKNGRGSHINYYYPTQNVCFAQSEYDWDNMLNTYNGTETDEQKAAVAKLMADCGASVNMQYDKSESYTYPLLIPRALISYFRYSPTARYFEREGFKGDWDAVLLDEIKAGRPVCYNGLSPFSGGHAFICDGYRGDGYFHFNFGYAGEGDGFYLTTAIIDPIFGYNYEQNMVTGICPDYDGKGEDTIFCFSDYGDGTAQLDFVNNINGSLEHVAIPTQAQIDGKTLPVLHIANQAFMECHETQAVSLPNDLLSIGRYAFTNCTGLTSIIIPATVGTIERKAFSGCTNLADVYNFALTPQSLTNDVFDTFGRLHVFKEAESLYKSDNEWKNFTVIPDLVDGINTPTLSRKVSSDIMFDLTGRRTNASHHGIVIYQGKRIIQ